ncbi:putative ABC transporter permease protein [alpha proteobacterium Q-1]|nr:ABC transporter permease [Iodidimonas nitroreducens]GAK33680.1 putative ABC transporter permease protein [alpha proteobacterium Q-1]
MDRVAPSAENQDHDRLSADRPGLDLDGRGDVLRLVACGRWVIAQANALEEIVAGVKPMTQSKAEIDLTALTGLDTVGAWLLYRLQTQLEKDEITVDFRFRDERQKRILAQIIKSNVACDIEPPEEPGLLKLIEEIGLATVSLVTNFGALLSFLGNVFARILDSILNPSRIRLNPLVHQMEVVGLRSLPIVGLISFLIGAVIVNQGAVQLRQFGAEILVVDMVSIGVLRELGVLLTSIIVAGRSGSAFAAQIGSMVMREEVAALKTLGISPIDVLVLPRFVAMALVLPLLTFFADVMGLLGGGLMAWVTLDIAPFQFLNRMGDLSLLSELYIGLIKSVFFAGVISISGCFQGLSAKGTAESLGQNTTTAVVESIFLVIVLDAFFAIFFTTIGW